MTTKLMYFSVNGITEKAEFSSKDSTEDVKDLFRSAAEAGSNDILKLYNHKGILLNISPQLEGNTPNTCYKLVVVAAGYDGIAQEVGLNIKSIEERLQALETKILIENGGVPDALKQVRHDVETLSSKIESIEHLSWIGLTKDLQNGYHSHSLFNNNWKKQITTSNQEQDDMAKVFDKFKKMSHIEVSPKVKEHLAKVDFNNWQWDEPEMLVLLRQMYMDRHFMTTFNIPMETLHNWLCEVYKHYNRVPFHNFKHCFMVSQMMYGLISLLELEKYFDQEEIFSLLTSAICHDLDHPGYNNTYQINARTELAVRYNDKSPLENHHSAVAFKLLAKDECNILKCISLDTYKRIRESMIRCILATDMARHNEILNSFKACIPTFNFADKEHRNILMMILIKCADISNECRPMEVAEPWIDCLLTEFFNQSDLEKKEGLPVSPFMDREKVNKNSSQVNFIQFVLLPLFDALAELFPQMHEPVIVPLQDALLYYRKLATSTQSLTNGTTSTSSTET